MPQSEGIDRSQYVEGCVVSSFALDFILPTFSGDGPFFLKPQHFALRLTLD